MSKKPLNLLLAVGYICPLLTSILSLRGLGPAIIYAAWTKTILDADEYSRLSIETSPDSSLLVANILVSARKDFEVFPHNIEFMVPGQKQVYFRGHPGAFRAELRVYQHAKKIHAISQFDAAILRCLGSVDVDVLSYEPVGDDRAHLESVRELRRTSEKQGILILGSVVNSPTRIGVLRLFELLRAATGNRQFVVAGNGTEDIAALAPPGVVVRGTVSSDDLRVLLSECKAMLVYQPQTTGMLTRLIESTIAGIPTYVMGGYQQVNELIGRGVYPLDAIADLPEDV